MKKVEVFKLLLPCLFLFATSPVFAQSVDVVKIETFIRSVIHIMVVLAGLLLAGFFVWGGVGYISSSGNPETLERSKRTIIYSAIGLAVVLGAFVLSNIVTDLATSAFGGEI